MKKNFFAREFTQWYLELMVWLVSIILFGAIAVILDFKPVLLVSVLCAVVLGWRMMRLQQMYDFYKTNLEIMRECFSDVAIFTWVSAFRTVLVSGNSKMLVEDWVPLGESMTKEQLEALLKRVTAQVEDTRENIYKLRIGNRDKWFQLRFQKKRGMQVYILSDVTESVTRKAELVAFTYYDMVNKLLSKEAFMKSVNDLMVKHGDYGAYVKIEIKGTERTTAQQKQRIDQCYEQIASIIKQQEQKHSVITGQLSNKQFELYYFDINMIEAERRIVALSDELRSYLESFNELNNTKLTYAGGACHYPEQAKTFHDLIARADFAVFEAGNLKESRIMVFSEGVYSQKEEEYSRIQAFNHVINGNLFDYHFQPIVNARTGEIFAYEALMRPRSDVPMTPLEVLKIAQEEGRLDEVERLTFMNTIRVLSENQDVFTSKKLFINSIPNCHIAQAFFDELLNDYGALLEKIVVEITEEQDMSPEMEQILQERYRNNNIQIALDDFGSGYANESSLLRCQPDYVKIDRSLLVNIDKDSKKRHLLSNMVNFAKEHGIKIIAEGIETEAELLEVIELNVDYIQGFCTSKPRSVMLLEISQEVSNHIVELNLKKNGSINVYQAQEGATLDLVRLAVEGYRVVDIDCKHVTLEGSSEHRVPMHIHVHEGSSGCNITMRDCHLQEDEGPIIEIAAGCKLHLKLEGDNSLFGDAIRVPEDAKLMVKGDGSLQITGAKEFPLGIGGNIKQSYGSIQMDCTGDIRFNINGDESVCIGGGYVTENSRITIYNGNYQIVSTGNMSVGIGSRHGVHVQVAPKKMFLRISSQTSVGIGAVDGSGSIETAGDIQMSFNGDDAVGVGVVHGQNGKVQCNGGQLSINVHTKRCVGIGTIDGEAEVQNAGAALILHMEGMSMVGIGNLDGRGDVTFYNGSAQITILSALRTSIGCAYGKVYIHSGNIVTNVPILAALNRYKENLEYVVYMTEEDIMIPVNALDGSENYVYNAKQMEDMPGYVGVLLPKRVLPLPYEETSIIL